jgi:cysteine-S-conjugate beta-lyase
VLLERFGVALSSGPKFGPNGAGFARINFATSEQLLDTIVDRIADAAAQSSMAW